MTSDREMRLRYADLLQGENDADLLRLVADLHHVAQTSEFPDDLEARLENALRERQEAPVRRRAREERHWRLPRELSHVVALTVAIVMAFAAGAAPRTLDPAPASAQVVLHRLAASHLPSYQGLHLVYRTWDTGHETGRENTWLEWNSHGTLTRVSEWDRFWTGGTLMEMSHSVQSGGMIRTYRYLPASLVVFVSSSPASRLGLPLLGKANLADGAGVQQFVAGLARHPRRDAQLLPDRKLDGVPVHVVRLRFAQGDPLATLYIDALSYILRGIDGGSGAGRQVASLRLMKEQVVPRSAVPPRVFKLRPLGLMVVHEP